MKNQFSICLLAILCVFSTCFSAEPSQAPAVNYTYYGKVVRVIDGSTVALDIDLGFGVWLHSKTFVLQDVSAPAPDGPDREAAMKAKTRVQEILSVGTEVVIQSIRDKKDKSGTFHAIVWKEGENVNEALKK